MFIKDGKRINIYAPYTESNGVRHANLMDKSVQQSLGISEVPDPEQPEDFDSELYFVTEQDFPPYITYTKRHDAAEIVTRRLVSAVDFHLNNVAQQHGYDSILSACSYAAAPNTFQEESIVFIEWRSAVWLYAQQVMTDVKAGRRNIPTSAELIAELPVKG